MCYCVYIATAKAQETGTFTPNKTELYLEEPSPKELVDLSSKFSNPHIYHVGSYSNCSCGFNLPKDQFENPSWRDARRSVERFIDLIKAETQQEDLEFYCCWAGNTASAPEEHIRFNANSISLENYFGLTENQFIIFHA